MSGLESHCCMLKAYSYHKPMSDLKTLNLSDICKADTVNVVIFAGGGGGGGGKFTKILVRHFMWG